MIGKLFTFKDAQWNETRTQALFTYVLEADDETLSFQESLRFELPIPECAAAEKLLQSLHIALGMSYYKSIFPPEISHPYAMDEQEATFWNSVWRNGFGEFMLINALPTEKLANFHAQDGTKPVTVGSLELTESAVVGIGGGKDSIVAGELLKKLHLTFTGFVLATGEAVGQAQAVAEVMGIPLSPISRSIDPALLELNNRPGVMNGHIPISTIFALVGCLIALSRGSTYVVVANEASASLPQARWQGSDVNHQWSKSLEFERLFQRFVHDYVHPKLHYFSAVRPLTSVAIAKIFSQYPAYFEVFTSDNSVFKIKQSEREHPRWSLNSSKSLSSYMLMSAWLPEEILLRIFGRDFLHEESLIGMGCRLLGDGEPVLDCVGTPEELRSSLDAGLERGHIRETSTLIQAFKNKGLLANTQPLASYLQPGDHAFPDSIAIELDSAIKETL